MKASTTVVTLTHAPIETCPDVALAPIQTLNAWLGQWKDIGFSFVLAWSTDGVTWGRVDRTKPSPMVVTSDSMLPDFSPGLNNTLQELRLFTDDALDECSSGGAELHAWRSSDGWRARLISDEIATAGITARDTCQIMRGTDAEGPASNGFTLVREGQGLRHAPPIVLTTPLTDWRCLRIHVREYLEVVDGVTRITAARLAGISRER